MLVLTFDEGPVRSDTNEVSILVDLIVVEAWFSNTGLSLVQFAQALAMGRHLSFQYLSLK